jgi:hypothetical protein
MANPLSLSPASKGQKLLRDLGKCTKEMYPSFLSSPLSCLFFHGIFLFSSLSWHVRKGNNTICKITSAEGLSPLRSAFPLCILFLYYSKIYVTYTDLAVQNVFLDGELVTLARQPNDVVCFYYLFSFFILQDRIIQQHDVKVYLHKYTGFYRTGPILGAATMTSLNLTETSGYWNGATIRCRTSDWRHVAKSKERRARRRGGGREGRKNLLIFVNCSYHTATVVNYTQGANGGAGEVILPLSFFDQGDSFLNQTTGWGYLFYFILILFQFVYLLFLSLFPLLWLF